MTIREYYRSQFAPSVLSDKPSRVISAYVAVIGFIEVLYHQRSEQLDIDKLTENHIRAVKAAALSCGYAPRTARKYTVCLRAILRHARPPDFPIRNAPRPECPNEEKPSHLTPEMLLVVYLRWVYFAKGMTSGSYLSSFLCAIDKLSEFLREPARVRHLSDEAVAGMLGLCEQQGLRQTTIGRYRQSVQSLWRHAIRRGVAAHGKQSLRRREPGSGRVPWTCPVSGEEGSLWWYCTAKFFRVNLRIRSEQTRHQYHIALRSYKAFLGHEPMLADLDDDLVTAWVSNLADTGRLSMVTINERVGRVVTLWTFLAKKRIVEQFPFVPRLKEPKRAPRAWTQEEMELIFATAGQLIGQQNGFLKRDWWMALLLVLWDSGARVGEIMLAEWLWLDLKRGILSIPAESRKGGERDMVYTLGADTLESLKRIHDGRSERIFYWPRCHQSLWTKFKDILKAAGLPHDRTCGFHKIRRTVASHMQAAGHDACSILRHSSPSVTIESYLDPAIVGTSRPCDILPRLGVNGRKDRV